MSLNRGSPGRALGLAVVHAGAVQHQNRRFGAYVVADRVDEVHLRIRDSSAKILRELAAQTAEIHAPDPRMTETLPEPQSLA